MNRLMAGYIELGSSQMLLWTVGKDAWQEQQTEAPEKRPALPLPGNMQITGPCPASLSPCTRNMPMVLHVQKRVSLPAPYPPPPLSSSQQDLSMTSLYKNLQRHNLTTTDFSRAISLPLFCFCYLGLPTHCCMSHSTPGLHPGHSLGLQELHPTSLEHSSCHYNLSLSERFYLFFQTSFKGNHETS